MSELPLFPGRTRLREAFDALRRDLIDADGPRISTMRNYRFAILQYEPADEFELRGEAQRLAVELSANGWMVLPIDLHRLFLRRLRAQGEDALRRRLTMERTLAANGRERGLKYLESCLAPLIEGPDGLAGDCSRIICDYADAHPDRIDRTLALIGRAGALYPFFRSSALLKHIDGRTRNVPVVLLYPGERRGDNGLSFMKVLEPDKDYRPRIYP